jgi:4'-phosphopantetheinyl transferase
VHIWVAQLSRASVQLNAFFEVLSRDEKNWANRFHSSDDRARHVLGRGLVRVVAGRVLGIACENVLVDYEAFGKPVLRPRGGAPDLRFNVSHSGDFVVTGFVLGRAIGIDLEEIVDLDFEPIARRLFSNREQSELFSLPHLQQREAFFRCWCRKEAYIKAQGAGFSCATDMFDVSLRPVEAARLAATRPDPTEAARWSIQDLELGPRYAAALAVEGSDFVLKLSNLLDLE